jgi:hypothetical protein
MILFIKKIKTKEGINSINLDKVRSEVPSEYKVLDEEPAISFSAKNVVIVYKCAIEHHAVEKEIKQPAVKKQPPIKPATKHSGIKKQAPAVKKAVVAKKTRPVKG